MKCFLSIKSAYRMISVGLFDIEDLRSDAENSALPLQEYIRFLNILKYKTVILNYNNITKYYCFSVEKEKKKKRQPWWAWDFFQKRTT